MAVVCDLDGVVWLADTVIPGAPEAVARLRAAGHTVLFVTNNSFVPVAEVEAKLARFGIPAEATVLTSAMAAATLVEPGWRVLVAGGPGVVEAVTARGCTVVREGPADAVMVGLHRDFDYDGLSRACAAVRAGARLVGTNDDATYPTPQGQVPGGGAILAAVRVASSSEPVIAGKPYAAMAALVRARLGPDARDAVMVGDRPDTDGRFARELGCRFALVLSGVTGAGDPADPPADLVAADLAALAGLLGA